MIKAIETRYKGYRFRSRLEARWAVFFDAMGIEWTYEPQGFEKDGVRYLPDFQIKLGHPQFLEEYWVEVKGDKDWLYNNRAELEEMHDYGGILPGFSGCGDKTSVSGGLIILGDIPEPKWGLMFVPVLGHQKGVNLYWRCLSSARHALSNFDQILSFHIGMKADYHCLSVLDKSELDFSALIVETPRAVEQVKTALIAARSARFEHGETPEVARQ